MLKRKIHPSHTKLDLIYLIQQLGLPVFYNGITKQMLVDSLMDYLKHDKEKVIDIYPNHFNLNFFKDIIFYLNNPTVKKNFILTCAEKQDLLTMARRIHGYISNGCFLERTVYTKREQLHADALYVSFMGGDIPTCRKAIYKLNETLGPDEKYDMVLSPEVKHALEIKKMTRTLYSPIFSKKKGRFVVIFD